MKSLSKHGGLIVVLLVGALIGAIAFLWPLVQTATQSDTEASLAPNFGSTVRIRDARIVLPGPGAELAMVYLDITNIGDRTAQLSEVRLDHADAAEMQNRAGPAWTPVASLDIAPGETLSLGPDAQFVVLSDYDSDVVPAASIDVTLVFGTSGTVTVPAKVFPAGSAT